MKGVLPLAANKAIVVVRNPLDVLMSTLQLINTASHNNKLEFDVSREYPRFWD